LPYPIFGGSGKAPLRAAAARLKTADVDASEDIGLTGNVAVRLFSTNAASTSTAAASPCFVAPEGAIVSKRHLLIYESKHDRLLPRRDFAKRLAKNAGVATSLIAVSLFAGMAGYHYFEALP
jgi:hypothetical protein